MGGDDVFNFYAATIVLALIVGAGWLVSLGVSDVQGFGSEGEYGPVHDWSGDPSGKSLSVSAGGGRLSSRMAHDRHEAFGQALNEFSAADRGREAREATGLDRTYNRLAVLGLVSDVINRMLKRTNRGMRSRPIAVWFNRTDRGSGHHDDSQKVPCLHGPQSCPLRRGRSNRPMRRTARRWLRNTSVTSARTPPARRAQNPDATMNNAVAQCSSGKAAEAIPVLEKALRDAKLDLPPRT